MHPKRSEPQLNISYAELSPEVRPYADNLEAQVWAIFAKYKVDLPPHPNPLPSGEREVSPSTLSLEGRGQGEGAQHPLELLKAKHPPKVLLALSGGVDSSVAAVLLKEQGYELVTAFMKIWSDSKNATGECSWKAERRDALRVAAKLDIPFVTFDFEKEYREQVASYLFSEYAAGRTPNPDVLCNEKVKFPLLWREAQRLGCDYIATGHHVRKRKTDYKLRVTSYELLSGKDTNKDQSYFLHRLTQKDLEHTLFPIGDYTKAEVRALARKYSLPTADKRSTRGICFIGKVKMGNFLSSTIVSKPGPIVTTRGEKIGEHTGLAPYTIGQRHGFGGGGGTPYFVVEKNPETDTLVVGSAEDPALFSRELVVGDTYWISGKKPDLPFSCQMRIRYRAALVRAKLRVTSYELRVTFQQPVRAPAPGQFAVFYDGEVCLGGGVITT